MGPSTEAPELHLHATDTARSQARDAGISEHETTTAGTSSVEPVRKVVDTTVPQQREAGNETEANSREQVPPFSSAEAQESQLKSEARRPSRMTMRLMFASDVAEGGDHETRMAATSSVEAVGATVDNT